MVVASSPEAIDQAAAGRLWAVLGQVPDPEIPAVSVVDLGIVRRVEPGPPARVIITPTYSGCPATDVIAAAISEALRDAGYADAVLETVLSPPWTTDWITPEGAEKLRNYGIAPPPPGGSKRALVGRHLPACPRCGSSNTQEISQFGSTPCKALWRCTACLEPFDAFKCL